METKGQEITAVFRYVQQVYKECQQMFLKMDRLMAPDWSPLYGNRTTKEVTSSLLDPERWLVEAIFRVYEGKNKKVNKGVTISFWGDIAEPIITAAKITYKAPNERDHWDIWNAWFEWAPQKEELAANGAILEYSPEVQYISEIKVFSLPLILIDSENALEMMVYKPLQAL